MKKGEIIAEVQRLLQEDNPQRAIELISKQLIKSESKYKICPRCGQRRMRSDNTKGICSICQQQDRPNSKYRSKEKE